MMRFDAKALYHALDQRRAALGLSWKLADEIGVSASTLTRVGGRMEVDGVLAMVSWLGLAVESFVRRSNPPTDHERRSRP